MAYGSFINVAVGTSDWLYIRPFISSKSDYGFSTSYATDDKILVTEAWSYGKKFRYSKGVIRTRRCRDGNCPAVESGIVFLSEPEFQTAAVNGFEFELIGKLGKVTGRIPAQAFREVLNLKSKLDPVATAPASGSSTSVATSVVESTS
jgi:hypothetical protein